MKHSLQLRLSQHLTLTPQLQQSIRLLQLSTLELNQEIERLLQENPLLEREDETREQSTDFLPESRLPSTASGDEQPDGHDVANEASGGDNLFEEGFGFEGGRLDGEEDPPQMFAAESQTLREHLIWQLSQMNLSSQDRKIVLLLIDSLDDDGYLNKGLEDLAAILPPELDIGAEELAIALRHLQNFDPVGVGARDLGECLALQLAVLPEAVPFRQSALEVVRCHLGVLAARDFAKLKKLLRCDDATLRGLKNLITALSPRPGARFSSGDIRYIVPDVVVKKTKGVWLVGLNPDAMPRLRINRLYADILQRNRDAKHSQLTSQLQEARWLIKNVQQRFDTILRVSQAIVDRQRYFFEHGEVAMRPLVLREIAEVLDLHESTVSRVTTQKFMLTPRGIFEFKYFFGSHVTTDSGSAASSTAIRALIKQLVNAENTCKPLSDSQLAQILGQQGIIVARRTVAKYRESMQILPVNLRKSI
jgi:RNA polymerase sigma-54 factor